MVLKHPRQSREVAVDVFTEEGGCREYPQRAEMEMRCVDMLSRLWHAPDPKPPPAAPPAA